jgi:hypothetical protein
MGRICVVHYHVGLEDAKEEDVVEDNCVDSITSRERFNDVDVRTGLDMEATGNCDKTRGDCKGEDDGDAAGLDAKDELFEEGDGIYNRDGELGSDITDGVDGLSKLTEEDTETNESRELS